MATFISTEKFERWWRKAQAWFATQFASINVDFTPVEDKLDDIKDDVAALSIPTVQQIQAGLALDSTVAKEATLGTTADSSVATTIFGWLKEIWDKLVGIVTTYPYAKEATLTDATNGLAAINAAVQGIAIPTDYAKQGSDATATNTALLNVLNSISTNMYKGVPVQTQTTNATIAPNIWNVWASVAGNLTITKGTDIANIVNEYMVRFTLASNWSGQIAFSGFTLSWNGGSEPTWTAGNTYEISIVNNIALWCEITPAS